jgi:hypothetical protein
MALIGTPISWSSGALIGYGGFGNGVSHSKSSALRPQGATALMPLLMDAVFPKRP